MKHKLILSIATISVVALVHAQWQLTGNSISGTDFLGSTNSQALMFKVNNSQSGLIDHVNKNTVLGYQALLSNTTGAGNTAMGYLALTANTSGANNIALGQISLPNNTTGTYNVGIGSAALFFNTTGNKNVAIGFAALDGNTTADNNVACGYKTLFSNTTGTGNSAFGHQALYSNTTTGGLTAIGYQALYSNTSGSSNTAAGYNALYSNTSGESNSSFGSLALTANTTGYFNTAMGSGALNANTTGALNTATGEAAMLYSTTGNYNTANGWEALVFNTGSNNTGVGAYALGTNTAGAGNTAIGYDADVNYQLYSNTTVIGNLALGTASNQVRIGNSSVTSIGGYANWSNISDGRFKKNVKENVPGLEFIKQLKPVTYNLDITGINRYLHPEPLKDPKTGRPVTPSANEAAAVAQKEQIVHTGFIAQDVESLAKKMGYDFSGIDAAKNDKDLYSLRYSDFVVPLVKAVQELNSKNESLESENQQMQKQLTTLINRISALERTQQECCNSSAEKSQASPFEINNNGLARLEQNAPNPFNNNTIIRYYIPENTASAQMIIADLSGHVLRNISIGSRGQGQLTIKAGTLSAGNYIYTLVIDGKTVDNKQMVLTK